MSYDYHARFMGQSLFVLKTLESQRRCGDCYKWNIHQLCPRESGPGLRGYSIGPSMADWPCAQFEPDANFAALLEVITIKKLES